MGVGRGRSVIEDQPARLRRAERFEDLIAWQKARKLTELIYQISKQREFGRDLGLAGQLQRATVSIMSNVAEGFERYGAGEFHQFLSIAKGSCAETRSLLYVALDAQYIDAPTFKVVLAQAEEVGRVIGGLRASVERQRTEERRTRRTL
jgi:four helix bundle protein